MIRIDL